MATKKTRWKKVRIFLIWTWECIINRYVYVFTNFIILIIRVLLSRFLDFRRTFFCKKKWCIAHNLHAYYFSQEKSGLWKNTLTSFRTVVGLLSLWKQEKNSVCFKKNFCCEIKDLIKTVKKKLKKFVYLYIKNIYTQKRFLL